MACTTYNQEVVFIHREKRNVKLIKLHKTEVTVWIPLQITEINTRTVFLHMSLRNGRERANPITLSVPLASDLSCDVTDYSCEALFQDDTEEKERISLMRQNSKVEAFSVDVNHIPPSIYTVTGLSPAGSYSNPDLPRVLPKCAALNNETAFMEDGLRKLVLSKTNTPDNQTKSQFSTNLQTVSRKTPPFSSLIFLKDSRTKCIFPFFTNSSEMTFPFQLRPITDFELIVFRGQGTQNSIFRVWAAAHCSFKSYMTKMEVYELYRRALGHTFCPGLLQNFDFFPVTHLYRTKPSSHFNNIFNNMNGVMYKYIKNFGGDPASTLNRKLHGLFFSASVDTTTGLPPPVSYYGDQRIHIPVNLMITPNTNLYFADFYCHYVNHKVTLVVTLKGSEADEFCRTRLVSLNQSFNEFLYRSPASHFAMVNTRVTVEVFYTESINIVSLLKSRYAFLTKVKQSGNPVLKTIVGIPKRKDSKICNLK